MIPNDSESERRQGSLNAEIAYYVLRRLYREGLRSSALTSEIAQATGASVPAVLSTINELVFRELVAKTIQSRKNVSYSLTARGRDLVQQEITRSRATLVDALRSSPEGIDITLDFLVGYLISSAGVQLPASVQETFRTRLQQLIDGEIKYVVALMRSGNPVVGDVREETDKLDADVTDMQIST